MENIQQMSMLEVAIKLMSEKRTKQAISKLIEETLEMKGIDDEDGEFAAQLYIDITTSSKFVYMGDNEWDLKSRQSLDEWDKDGSAFNTGNDEEEVIDEEADSFDEFYSTDTDTKKDSSLDSDEEYDEDGSDNNNSDEEYDEDDYDASLEKYIQGEYDDENDYMDEKYMDYLDEYDDMYED